MAVLNTIPTPREILNRRNAGSTQLFFPSNIETNPHRTVMLFNTYSVPRGPRVGEGGAAGPTFQATIGITLPVPIKIVEPYKVTYQKHDLELAGAGIVNALNGNIGAGVAALGLAGAAAGVIGFANLANPATGAPANPMANLGSRVINSLTPGIKAATGLSINPFTTAMFKSVDLRLFELSFKLSPQSSAETDSIEKIIDAIRVRMHPEPYLDGLNTGVSIVDRSASSNLLLKTPELVTFKILNSITGEGRTDTSFPTAPCFVLNFTVDRTGADYPTFYAETGAPVVYFLQIALLEVLPLLRNGNRLRLNNPLELVGRFRE